MATAEQEGEDRKVSPPQKVFVSGAGSGIGAAIARAFAAQGATLVLADRNRATLDSVAQQLSGASRVEAHVLDIRDAHQVAELMNVAGDEPFDLICANAGVSAPEGPFHEMAWADIERILDVNIRGTICTLRAGVPHLRDGGSIVVTASTSGIAAHPGAAVYAASKHAVIGLARSLAAELAPRRIRVNAVCPGGVDTPLLSDVYGSAEDAGREYAKVNPMGRLAAPEDVAAAVVFLADAVHITGVALRIDGGDTLGVAI